MPAIDPKRAPRIVADWLDRTRPMIEDDLGRRLPADKDDDPGRLREAMRYATLGGGKRLRPCLVLAACEAAGGSARAALPAAAAIELLHAYTLVHDDLPALDNDDERRGRPTVHKAFGEDMAILTGDALLTAAFAALAELDNGAAAAVRVLGKRAGTFELLAGQARDLELAKQPRALTIAELEVIHAGKTGALFAASAELGAIAAAIDSSLCQRFGDYGLALGIAFQHADDADDAEHTDMAREAAARRSRRSERAASFAAELGGAGDLLLAFARWIGGIDA